jgi:hypothetical protein
MSNKTFWIIVIGVVLCLTTWAFIKEYGMEGVVDTAPSASASSSAVPIPSASTAPSTSASVEKEGVPPPVLRELPKNGEYIGTWKGRMGLKHCLRIREKEALLASGGEWNIPYPYYLTVREGFDEVEDCGFFPAIQGDNWRTGFCLEDEQRTATRIYLFDGGDENTIYLSFDGTSPREKYVKGECK